MGGPGLINRTTLLVLALALNPPALTVFAQLSAISYQGKLSDGGNPADGSYDLTFAFCSMPTGGTPLAGPITNAPTTVANGLFTVYLTNVSPGERTAGPREIARR